MTGCLMPPTSSGAQAQAHNYGGGVLWGRTLSVRVHLLSEWLYPGAPSAWHSTLPLPQFRRALLWSDCTSGVVWADLRCDSKSPKTKSSQNHL